MDKAYYIIGWRAEYVALLRSTGEEMPEGARPERLVVAISQGGFGEGVVDFRGRVKERFLEYEFSFRGLDLPCTPETFDRYFSLEEPAEFVDLDA